jgi:HAD superfamily hydrolase (TIGR01509 family)
VQPDVRNAVASWSGSHLEILSNHRSRWLRPLLDDVGLTDVFTRVHISEELGLAKPQAAIFHHAARGLPANAAVLYVDDAAENLRAGQSTTSWRTSLASADQKWIASVDAWLRENEADAP